MMPQRHPRFANASTATVHKPRSIQSPLSVSMMCEPMCESSDTGLIVTFYVELVGMGPKKRPENPAGLPASVRPGNLSRDAYWQIATAFTMYICARMKSRMLSSVCTSVNLPLGQALASC